MSDEQEKRRREEDAELQREIRRGRKFTLQEAIAELAGPGGMKGASPIARMEQAEVEIANWLRLHLVDNGGALGVVLHRSIKASEVLLKNYNEPLVVLADCCRRILASDFLLGEIVRNADIEWGRMMGERPYLEKKGRSATPMNPIPVSRSALA